jgi:CRISPR-associated protein Cas1
MTTKLLPVRMLNEYIYCPRLFGLEHVHGEWAPSADTADGDRVHRRVDRETRADLEDLGEDGPRQARSVYLSDEELGLVAKIDLVEGDGDEVVPIDYKRGSPPKNAHRAWDPERVQVCAQGLLLRRHGHTCDRGFLWFAETRQRVEVVFDEELIALTLEGRDRALALVESGGQELPPPLIDSPKCPRCSLVGICLPDETNQLAGRSTGVRPMIPARDDGVPLHVQLVGGKLGKSHDEIVIRDRKEEVGRARIGDTSALTLYGNATISTPLLSALAERGIPIAFHSYGGWFRALAIPAGGHGVPGRIRQHQVASDPTEALKFARSFIAAKIQNCRVLLRRNGEGLAQAVLVDLKQLAKKAGRAGSAEELLGLEGAAARLYFQNFTTMLRADEADFDFAGRNRRPPRDPVNALLSFAYSFLARECTAALHRVGLDPYVGLMHRARPGRPALALDLMEEFRPILADSAVIRALNNGEVERRDFVVRSTGTSFTQAGRRKFISTIERRMVEEVTHPSFGTRLSYRRVLEVQARLLAKSFLGDLPEYPAFRVR